MSTKLNNWHWSFFDETALCVQECFVQFTNQAFSDAARDVVLPKEVWERTQKKQAICKHLRTHVKAKQEKGVGRSFPRVPAPLHPWMLHTSRM